MIRIIKKFMKEMKNLEFEMAKENYKEDRIIVMKVNFLTIWKMAKVKKSIMMMNMWVNLKMIKKKAQVN